MADVTGYEAEARALLAQYDQTIGTTLHIVGDRVAVARVAVPWWIAINEVAKAAFALFDAGMSFAAHALTRQALEYTISVHWLVEAGDDGLSGIGDHQQTQLKKVIGKKPPQILLPQTFVDEVNAYKPSGVDEAKAAQHFEQMCKEVGAEELYFVYRWHSQYAHPSLMAASEHSRFKDGTFVLTPNKGDSSDQMIAIICSCLIWAGRAIDSLMQGEPRKEDLVAAAARLSAPEALPPRSKT